MTSYSMTIVLQLKTKYLAKRRNLYCLVQTNLVEFLVQVCLPYIPLVCSLYTLTYIQPILNTMSYIDKVIIFL